jgi:aminoglycoside phosphotransferase (APT) family kinase protein
MEPRQEGEARLARTLAVTDPAGIDTARLTAWLTENVAGFARPLSLKKFAGGQSNPTFLLTTPQARYVLRRQPLGPLLKGAHAVDREARVMKALAAAGFPVPRVHALCTDPEVIGSWFYVMDFADGRIFWDGALPDIPREERAAYQFAMASTIAELHTLDPVALGLEDYGRTGGYFQRQLDRWTRQYRADDAAGRLADMDAVADWLQANVPADGGTRLVHGDYRIDNLVFAPDEPRIIAVLDWELSTLGDPLVDVAYNLLMYRVPSALPWGLADRDLAALGLPDERSYIADYCRRTGRDDIPDLDTYIVFNLFRMAAIIHGIKGRMLRGNAASADAGAMVAHLDLLARTARSIAERRGGWR